MKSKVLLSGLFLILFFFGKGYAVTPGNSNPYEAAYTHLYFLQPGTYEPEKAAIVINLDDKEKAKELAIKIKQVLDGKGLYVDLDIIPMNPDYVDSASGRNRYFLFKNQPDIYLEKFGNRWYYSSRTLEVIPSIHRSIYPFGSDFLLNLMPKAGRKVWFGLELWQHLGILILIFFILLVHKLQVLVIERVIQRVLLRYGLPDEQLEIYFKVARNLSYAILTVSIQLVEPMLLLPIQMSRYIVLTLSALTPFFLAVAAYFGVDILSLYMEKQAQKTETTLDDQLVPLVRKSLKFFVFISGVLFILNSLEFNVTALLAGISIGGLALALAAQDTIKNLFGSLMIFLDKPFQIGDRIVMGDVDGIVEEVGFRSSRVRTFANSLVYVPNGRIADSVIDNYGLRVYRRFSTKISITYDTPPHLIEKFVYGLREIIRLHPSTRKDAFEVHLNDMGSDSLHILFHLFFLVPGWSGELVAKHEILLSVIRLAEQLGIRFAFPTQTLFIEEIPGQKSLSPVYESDEENLDTRLKKFLEDYRHRYVGEKPTGDDISNQD